MFDDRSHLSDHMNHGATTVAGVLTMASADPGVILSYVGAIIGIGGLLCSISREVRGFLDRRDNRSRPRNGG